MNNNDQNNITEALSKLQQKSRELRIDLRDDDLHYEDRESIEHELHILLRERKAAEETVE